LSERKSLSLFFCLNSTLVKIALDIIYNCRDSGHVSKPAIDLTTAEWSVIKAIWETEPCTAPAIQVKLFASTGWAYSTVRTLMDRMVAKGVLTAKKDGKLTIYHSAVTRVQAQRGELFYTLKHAFNGALTPMVQCLLESRDLDTDELAQIEALIKARKKAAKK
jgi:BlaI family transcriptional regulator, penicillinase repressor